MKSAYAVLGIPGNASTADIDQALQTATAHFSKARLVDDPDSLEKLLEVREAHKLLSQPDMRAAHDRKLSAAVVRPSVPPRTSVAVESTSAPWCTKPLVLLALAVVAVFSVGGYMSASRDQARQAQAARDMAEKTLAAEAQSKADADAARADAARARSLAMDQSRERQLRSESSSLARNAANNDLQQQSMALRQIEADRQKARNREMEDKAEERQRVADAQRRLAIDQQRIRELCLLQYRRPNC